MNDLDRKTEYLKALASPIRLKIIENLKDGPKMSQELREKFKFHASVLTQHMRKLEIMGIVKGFRVGRYVKYTIADKNTLKILGLLPQEKL